MSNESEYDSKFQYGRDKVYTSTSHGYGCNCEYCQYKYGRYRHPDAFTKHNTKSKVDTKLEANFDALASELKTILLSKHADYGNNNILNTPGGPLNGINVRLYDKIERLTNLLTKKENPNNESIRDTLLDIANYAIIGMLVVDNKWEK